MTDLVITNVHIVHFIDKFDAPAQEVFGYEAVRYHTDGTVTPANGTTAGEANFQGIATIPAQRIGQAVTVVRDGLLDVGDALGTIAFGAPIYLSDTDGTLSDSAGDSTVDVIVARVVPAFGTTPTGADRLLRVRKEG